LRRLERGPPGGGQRPERAGVPQRRPAPQPHTAPTPQALNHKPHASTIQDIAAYLRIDHTGEVCAQALYLGQASQARTPHLTEHLLYSAEEEEAHLQWCAQRLNELGDKPSRFNLIWYALSFTLGAAIARLGDRISLGFIHATEHQVKRHLQEHIDAIGTHDPHSTAILAEMLEEENQHAAEALKRGGVEFPTWIQSIMWTTSRLMAQVSRRY
ncbi:MAG: 2-polyprenyl-3-methyl-6-methoxy-1,4-benzoquinone monooxygenase, partial [Gammaproteobacteria bacterium]